MMSTPPPDRPSVVIVGGGMGGIQAAKTLATAPVDITLVNPHNYYLFQPLIYEVANALLQAEDVAHSIRGMLRYLPNLRFRVAAASSVDWERSELRLDDGDRIGFDYLILAIGLQADFCGIPGAAEHALPLKSLDDALKIRTQMLRRLETVASHPALVPAGALDVVVVGGGTTGVETAGAFAEIYHHALPEEFAELDFSHAEITLLEAGEVLLAAFHPRMQQAAQRMLVRRGVRVRLHAPVAQVGPASVTLTDGQEIPAGMIVWATGVRATRLADSLALRQTPDSRILVQPNLSLPGHPEAFAIGDMAALPRGAGGLHPALAQFAIQGGRHAAREIMRHIDDTPSRPFRYWDKGMTASVGRDAGIVQSGHVRFSGRLAFFAWGVLHSLYVPGWRNRLSIDLNWLWSYVTHRRAALMLIDEPPAAQEHPAFRQLLPAANARPGADDARHRDIPGSGHRTPPSGQGLGTPRLRTAAQAPARAGVTQAVVCHAIARRAWSGCPVAAARQRPHRRRAAGSAHARARTRLRRMTPGRRP
jgi:NADH:quinone reductase (non-electrogenic)